MASNFNDTVPAAPAGGINVLWQTDGAGNDSAYVPSGSFIPVGGGDFVKLAETILAIDTASILFSTISGAYRNLKIFLTGRSADADGAVYIQFNGDTGTNYNAAYAFQGAAAGNGTQLTTAIPTIAFVTNNTAPSGDAATTEITIFDYARTAWNKNSTSLSFRIDTASNLYMFEQGFIWSNTAAITDIKVAKGSGGNLAAGTVASLYGIK